MTKFFKTAAQGEITITKIVKLPAGLKPVSAVDGRFIIGHSETGHHHVISMERAQVFDQKKVPAGMRVLYAVLDAPNALEHLRNFDTHKPIGLEPGIHKFSSGREFDHYAALAREQAD